MIPNPPTTGTTSRKRLSTTTAVLLILGLFATACGNSTAVPNEPVAFADEEIELTMWTWPGGGHELLIDQFEEQNPGITVVIQESAYKQHHEGLVGATSSNGEVPDVAAIEAEFLPAVWHMEDEFTDLREFGADDLSDVYLDWRFDQGRTPTDRIIGLPTDVGGLALAYRKDLFAAAGLPSEPDEVAEAIGTWDEFFELGEQFRAANPDVAFLDSPDSVFETRFGQEVDGYLGVADGTNNAVSQAWDVTIRAIDDDLAASLLQFSPEWNTAMANGGFAATVAPSWMRGYLSSNNADNAGLWGLAPIPGVYGNWGGSALAIPQRAEHPEAAWKLVKFLTSEKGQFEIFQEAGNFPSTPAAYERAEIAGLQDPFFDNQVVGPLYIESVLGAPARAYSPKDPALREAIGDAFRDYQQKRELSSAKTWDQLIIELKELEASD